MSDDNKIKLGFISSDTLASEKEIKPLKDSNNTISNNNNDIVSKNDLNVNSLIPDSKEDYVLYDKICETFLKLVEKVYYYDKKIICIFDDKIAHLPSYNVFFDYLIDEDINNVGSMFKSLSKEYKKSFREFTSVKYNSIQIKNQIALIQNQYDLFLDKDIYENFERTLTIKKAKFDFTNKESMIYKDIQRTLLDISDEEKKLIVNDYRTHFKEFDEIIKWLVALQFSNDKRSSFLHLHMYAGFGKSFFIGLFEDLNIGFKTKPEKIFKSPCDHRVFEVEGRLAMLIDEFTIFKKDFKDLLFDIRVRELFGSEFKIAIGGKIFCSAEKSPSFDDGVDDQILDRMNQIIKKDGIKLDERPLKKQYGGRIYHTIVKEYLFNRVIDLINEFISLGIKDADIRATNFIEEFYQTYTLRKNTKNLNETIKEKFLTSIYEIAFNKNENLTKDELEIKKLIITTKEDLYIRSITKVFETYLKNESENFSKKAKYKASDIEDILGRENKAYKLDGNTIRCIHITKKELEDFINKSNNEDNQTLINFDVIDDDYLKIDTNKKEIEIVFEDGVKELFENPLIPIIKKVDNNDKKIVNDFVNNALDEYN